MVLLCFVYVESAVNPTSPSKSRIFTTPDGVLEDDDEYVHKTFDLCPVGSNAASGLSSGTTVSKSRVVRVCINDERITIEDSDEPIDCFFVPLEVITFSNCHALYQTKATPLVIARIRMNATGLSVYGDETKEFVTNFISEATGYNNTHIVITALQPFKDKTMDVDFLIFDNFYPEFEDADSQNGIAHFPLRNASENFSGFFNQTEIDVFGVWAVESNEIPIKLERVCQRHSTITTAFKYTVYAVIGLITCIVVLLIVFVVNKALERCARNKN
uniref:Recep_L_domain domain-containing protein n=1 Tax=Panagrellus redivivus TaxID=6233 RepID=A0A7E4W6V9_PANRE